MNTNDQMIDYRMIYLLNEIKLEGKYKRRVSNKRRVKTDIEPLNTTIIRNTENGIDE